MKPKLLAGILLCGMVIISACGQADEGLRGDAPESASSNTTATSLLPDPTVPTSPIVKVSPTVDIGTDIDPQQMISAALEYSRWREAIVSGEPEAVLAVPGTAESIRLMGLNIGNWDPACTRPMYLVILKGNFDGQNLFVIPTDERELPGQYVAYVFDLSSGVPGSVTFTILSEDGAAFKQALDDPSLPDPDFTVPEPSPPYPPCEDVTLPSNPEPTASP